MGKGVEKVEYLDKVEAGGWTEASSCVGGTLPNGKIPGGTLLLLRGDVFRSFGPNTEEDLLFMSFHTEKLSRVTPATLALRSVPRSDLLKHGKGRTTREYVKVAASWNLFYGLCVTPPLATMFEYESTKEYLELVNKYFPHSGF
jgi:hypothetical protein